VPILTTFDTPEMLHLIVARLIPFFEASIFFVTDVVALGALDGVFFGAILGLVTHFVAFEAHFLVAVKRLVVVFAAKDAVHALGVVGAFTRHVTKLLAVEALDCDVFFCPVA
jgi:ABC-type microcin C transport system permease subunit YejE